MDLNELLVKRPAATFFVRVEGDSMIGAGIHDKDLLVVDRSLTPANGDIIIADYGFAAIPERWVKAVKTWQSVDELIERFQGGLAGDAVTRHDGDS